MFRLTKLIGRANFKQEIRRPFTKLFNFPSTENVIEPRFIIPWSDYEHRRKAVCASLENETVNGKFLAILFSGSVSYKAPHVLNYFKPNSDFYYLTGLSYPDSCLLLTNCTSGADHYKAVVFITRQTTEQIKWEGQKASLETCHDAGLMHAHYFDELPAYLQTNLPKTLTVYTEGRKFNYSRRITDIINEMSLCCNYKTKLLPVNPHIHKLKSVKSPKEVEIMRTTCNIASSSFIDLIRTVYPDINESTIAATFEFCCRMRGASNLAYIPVVAGGNRANTIHYMDNCRNVKSDELVLMDAGCEVSNYCSDVSRTFPVGGEFTKYQRIVYEIVLETQKSLITFLKPGITLPFLHQQMLESLTKYAQQAGIINKWNALRSVRNIVTQLCPHFVGHHLGLDVHDCESLEYGLPLVPGNIVTVEPGLYIDINNMDIRPEFRGIGVRIEDDVLVTDNSNENLTACCPKEVDDILAVFNT